MQTVQLKDKVFCVHVFSSFVNCIGFSVDMIFKNLFYALLR